MDSEPKQMLSSSEPKQNSMENLSHRLKLCQTIPMPDYDSSFLYEKTIKMALNLWWKERCAQPK